MTYTDLFIDFDDTLYDTRGNAVVALRELFEECRLDRYFDSIDDFTIPYWQTNVELWDLYGRGEIERDYLIVERFRRPLATGHVRSDDGAVIPFDPSREYCLEISDRFLDLCACKSGVVEGAHELMRYLKDKGYRMHMCSNGFHEVQYRKLRSAGLLDYFDSVILSEDAGANKPAARFFDYAFEKTGASRRRGATLMIGDNFKADILGAKAAGIDVMFFNRHPESFAVTEPVDYEVHALREIMTIL